MKKKLLPFILGLSMVAALPFAAHADETTTEQDSGNVTYNGFADVQTTESGNTPVLTAIPECTMTIPKDTTIKRGSLSANIGRVTIDGKYFVKPYYIEVEAARKNFTVVEGGTAKAEGSALAKEDIVFDVATAQQATEGVNPTTANSAETNHAFVQSGTIGTNMDTKKTTYENGCRAARRFWKDETLSEGQDTDYLAGEIVPINGQENVFVNIATTQWTGVSGSEDDTKPVGGKYSGNITFTATFKDDFDSTWSSAWHNLT